MKKSIGYLYDFLLMEGKEAFLYNIRFGLLCG